MALADTTIRTATPSFLAVVDGWVRTLKLNNQRRAIYRQTRRELGSLSNRELADIGLNRAQIDQISLNAAYLIR